MNSLRSWLMALALMLASVASGLAAAAGAVPPHVAKPPFPQLTLPDRASSGQRAIDLLGARLPEVAAWYGRSADEFRALLLNDRRMRVDARGRVFVVDELDGPLPAGPETTTTTTGLLDGSLAPLDQTFLLHSRPGAKRTIHLNFRGATLSGTAWNGGSGSLTALPFDLDGLPYSVSTAELQRIQYIWQRVAEDYAPFDVNVTTEAPPPDLITRSGSGDAVFGTVVLVTQSTGVYNCNCGGVAYLGVFDDTSDYYKPALVFYDKLGGGNEKYVAEAISHEAGHNMGLAHDGYSGGGYYGGHGSGATGWAPIMGVGYSQPLVQWSKGEYATATNVQDDYAVMQGNGLPLRVDDHGDSAGAASPMAGTASGGVSTLGGSGVIERPGDVDVFSFSAGAGSASFNVVPAARSANLDIGVVLRDAGGQVLASVNPAEALGAPFAVVLPAPGTYFLSVQGIGKGDPLATGYTAYGSVGQYGLAASVPTPAGQAPLAVIAASTQRGTAPLAVNFSSAGSSDPDGSIVAQAWTFGDGSSAGGASVSHVYTVPGSYVATLTVTDNSGLAASRSLDITVDPPLTQIAMRVADIAMSLKVLKNGNASATAAVTVRDAGGPVVGASVSATWSGIVSRSGSAVTDSLGVASFTSPSTRIKNGSFVFTIGNVLRDGHVYVPATNTETQDSIAR